MLCPTSAIFGLIIVPKSSLQMPRLLAYALQARKAQSANRDWRLALRRGAAGFRVPTMLLAALTAIAPPKGRESRSPQFSRHGWVIIILRGVCIYAETAQNST